MSSTSRRARHGRRSEGPSLFRKGVAVLGTLGLAATGIAFGTTAALAAAPVNGIVYLDYAGNGVYDSSGEVQDSILGGVTVTAYDADGNKVGETTSEVTTTDSSNYSLDLDTTVADGDPLRIEFTGLPHGSYDTFTGSSVQFTTAGGDAVDFGAFDPMLFNDGLDELALATGIINAGAREHADVSGEAAVVGTAWGVGPNVDGKDDRWINPPDSGGVNTQVPNNPEAAFAERVEWATYGEVGSVYSMDYDQATRDLYVGATYKRISELGPEGLGGIYVIEGGLDADGEPKARTGLRSFDVEELGIDVGSGEIVDQTTRGLAEPNKLIHDLDPFEKAGKVGIGGIAIDGDARILYFVNLFDKKLYALDISGDAPRLLGSWETPAGANQQAFALALHNGDLFVGYNDTGGAPWESAADAGMNLYVAKAEVGADGLSSSWDGVLEGDLGYSKGNTANRWGGGDDYGAAYPQILRWNSWTDTWGELRSNSASRNGTTVGINDKDQSNRTWGAYTHIYPQPLVSGITIDRDGYMTLGIMDRTALQGGNRNWAAHTGETTTELTELWETLSSGDVLIAAPNTEGTALTNWTLENDGSVGDRTATQRQSYDHQPSGGDGPGGTEFYDDSQGRHSQATGRNNENHQEIGLGSVVVAPGAQEVAGTVFDPLNPVRAAGLRWFDTENGDANRGYQHTWDPGDPGFSADRTSFQKGGGMAGLALLTKTPPVEIGDRVWLDIDGDGIQDAGEPSIEGAVVELWTADADGNPVDKLGETTTDENGNYLFRSGDAAEGGTEGFTRNGDYVVVFKPGSGDVDLNWHGAAEPSGWVDPTWGDLELTTQEADDGLSDDLGYTRDSNPDEDGNAPVSVGGPGQNDHTIDAGWRFTPKTYAIGDVVWIDTNEDGVQDDGEDPLEGVTVNLLDENEDPVLDEGGNPVTTTTDDQGRYLFDNLPAGKYIVEFVLPDGYTFTEQNADDATGETDSDADESTGRTGVIDLGDDSPLVDADEYDGLTVGASKGVDPTWDAGVVPVPAPDKVTVGDRVWLDDGNGRQDDGEPGIPGVVLEITGPDGKPVTDVNGDTVGPVTTDEDGNYLFENLPVLEEGQSYTVTIDRDKSKDALEGLVPTKSGEGDREGDSSDWTESTRGLTQDGDEDLTLDFGFVKPEEAPGKVTVGDFVWEDLNDDGLQTPGEPGIEGVELELVDGNGNPVTDVNGNPVGTQFTDGNGHYKFTDLPVLEEGESYTVRIVSVPKGYTPAKHEQGDDRTVDSSTDQATTTSVTKDGDEDLSLDFGFVKVRPGADIVKADSDGNDANTADAAADLSGTDGSTTVVFTIINGGEEPLTNIKLVDVASGSGTLGDITCETPEGSTFVGSVEWEGELAVGGIITCEAPLTGVAAGAPHSNTVTLWADGALTGKPVEDPDNPSEDPENPNRPEDPYNAKVKTYAVGDYVWIDSNEDGLQDSDESPLAGVMVNLLDKDGNVIKSTTTDSNGLYLFDGLKAGEYEIEFVAPEGYEFTKENAGSDDAADSDANGNTGRTGRFLLNDDAIVTGYGAQPFNATEGVDPTWDAGFVPVPEPAPGTVTVGDKVWKDTNRDGRQDDGEPGIPGVVLEITGPDGEPVIDVNGDPVGPVTTDEDGNYRFENLPVLEEGQSYTVTIDRDKSEEALGNFIPTKPGQGDREGDSSDWTESTQGLNEEGDEDLTLDFGFVEPKVTVGDKVWKDTNRDGRQDPGEPGIPGVVLEIRDPEGNPVTDVYGKPVGPVTTDENGNYRFEDLPALPDGKSYKVIIDREASKDAIGKSVPTQEGVGDREGDSSTWEAITEGLNNEGDEDLTLDFGFVDPSVTVGDRVWFDKNGNGRQDDGEPGIPGVVLNIVGPDGKPVIDVYGNPVKSVKTDKDGNYLFTDLPALEDGQSYTVIIDRDKSAKALKGLEPTKPGVGDREGDSSTWEEITEGLTADGDEDLTLDFGFTSTTGELPSTGADPALWVLGALTLLGAGGAIAYGARRRQSA